MRRVASMALWLALTWGAAVAGNASFRGRVVLEDFEHFLWGEDWAAVQFSGDAIPKMFPEAESVHGGDQACRLVVPPGASLTLVAQSGSGFVGKGDKPPLPIPGTPQKVGLWVSGHSSGHRLWFRLLDGDGERHELPLGAVDFEGWRPLEADVPALTPPLGLRALVVTGGKGPLVIDDLMAEVSSPRPCFARLSLQRPREPLVAGRLFRLEAVVQAIGDAPRKLTGRLTVFPASEADRVIEQRGFGFRAAPGNPSRQSVRLRLPAGAYGATLVVGGAEARRKLVVYPSAEPESPPPPSRQIRRFARRGDALRVYQSALSPAVAVEVGGRELSLFRSLARVGLAPPGDVVFKGFTSPEGRFRLREPWLLAWFGSKNEWTRVRLADGSPSESFDAPFLIVVEHEPEQADFKDGVRLVFRHKGERVAVMPLCGVWRLSPTATARWRDAPEAIARLAVACRRWVRALRAFPIGLEEQWRLDPRADLFEVRVRFRYLRSSSDWGGEAQRVAPVPPLLTLARQAGLPIELSAEPVPTDCFTSLGPYWVVPEAEGYTYRIRGVLRSIHEIVADVPPGNLDTAVTLARHYSTLADDTARFPWWVSDAGERGRRAAEALLHYVLAPANAHCQVGHDGKLRAWDGLAWKSGRAAADAATAEILRGCWFAGVHAGLWEAIRSHWHQVRALHDALDRGEDWATLGLGDGPVDARLNAEVYYARMAARLGRHGEYALACGRAAKLLVAAYALAARGGDFASRFRMPAFPPGKGQVAGRCRPGSLGFAPGPPPFVTSPSDAGYGFAARWLEDYLDERYSGGPHRFFGRSLAEWKRRLLVFLGPPEGVEGRWWPNPVASTPFRGNYVFSIEPGPDGWPALFWRSHRSPRGGPLMFGTIGTSRDTKGELLRVQDASPFLRLSAYGASEVQPAAKERGTPQPPPRARRPEAPAGDTPDQGRP